MRLGLSLSRKKVQWKCCIKPLIRVEHIRIILRAQSGSCYAAACVVLLAPEFSPLIGVRASVLCWECRVAQRGILCGVCVCKVKTRFEGKAWGVCAQADAKCVDWSVTESHGWKSRWGSLFLLLHSPLFPSTLCCPSLRFFPCSTAPFIKWWPAAITAC